jgi:periplasmic divalent cation tolerance protein
MGDERVVLVTVPNREEGERIAEILVGERLAACVNLVGPIRSIYRWEGAVCRDDELLLVIKTTQARYADLEARVLATHPYQTPEVIALPIVAGADGYLRWLKGEVGS